MPSVDVAGLRIAYSAVGSGPPLILLHGILADGRVWPEIATRLADAYTVIAWDAPGCGQSSDHPPGFRMADHAAVLDGFASALGLGRPHLVGHSWGAVLALAAYQHRPSFARSLVLANGYAGWAGSMPPSMVRDRLATALAGLDTMTTDGVVQAWLPSLFSSNAEPMVVDALASIMRDFRRDGGRDALRAVAEADLREVLPSIDVPTLIVHAELDVRAPVVVAEALAAAIPSAQFANLPGVGHMSYLEAPDEFGSTVRNFLVSVR
jgi:pimeloyl-ACP methyl ester carboxylesterase